jgi:hypothetical protein
MQWRECCEPGSADSPFAPLGCGSGAGRSPEDAGTNDAPRTTGTAGASAGGGGGGATGGGTASASGGTGGGGAGAAAGQGGGSSAAGAGVDAAAGNTGDAAADRVDTPAVDAGPSPTRQTPRTLGTNGAPNGYLEYLPPGYDGSSAAPLLVFWHGIGEDGNGTTDLQKLVARGPPKIIANDKWSATRPFIVLSPQFTATSGQIAPGAGCPSGATIDTFLT